MKSTIPTSHMYVAPSTGKSTFVEQFECKLVHATRLKTDNNGPQGHGTIDFSPYLSVNEGDYLQAVKMLITNSYASVEVPPIAGRWICHPTVLSHACEGGR